MRPSILFYFVFLLFACKSEEIEEPVIEVSGDYYDWTLNNAPESPYIHDYGKTLVVKLFLAERDSSGSLKKVYADFEQCLENIKKLDEITLGIPKIAYLVGWQYNGHDSKYPSWDEVNPALKRDQDKTALESLKWLLAEAKKYNTTVSVHINMLDAYEDSPLWEEYLREDIIAKDSLGIPIKGERHSGMQSYQLSYAKEWELGYSQKRIDNLLKMLPELKDAGTIHIDAFHNNRPSSLERLNPDAPRGTLSPYLSIPLEDEIATQRKIIRYFKHKGMDVTSEYSVGDLRLDPHIGLEPFVWHYNEQALQAIDWRSKPSDFRQLPKGLLIGTPMHAEQEIKYGGDGFEKLLEQFALKVVPWYNKNNPEEVFLSSGILREDAVIQPVLWRNMTILAYSKNRDLKIDKFILPNPWQYIPRIQLSEITTEGIHKISEQNTRGMRASIRRTINLDLEKGKVYLITVAG